MFQCNIGQNDCRFYIATCALSCSYLTRTADKNECWHTGSAAGLTVTCGTLYSQCLIQAYWFHLQLSSSTRFLVSLEKGLWISGRQDLSVVFSQVLIRLSPRLRVCQTQTLWVIIGWSSLGSFSVPEWFWKEVGKRWKHPSSLDQPDLLDQAGRQQILSTGKPVVATQKRRERGS